MPAFVLHTSRVVVCLGFRGDNGCLTVLGIRYRFVRKSSGDGSRGSPRSRGDISRRSDLGLISRSHGYHFRHLQQTASMCMSDEWGGVGKVKRLTFEVGVKNQQSPVKDRASSPEPSPRRKVNPGSYEDEDSPCGFSPPSGAPGTVSTTITGLGEPQTFTNVAACCTPVARFNTENASFILPGTLAGILQDNFSIIRRCPHYRFLVPRLDRQSEDRIIDNPHLHLRVPRRVYVPRGTGPPVTI